MTLRAVASRIGVPGLLTWVFMVGIYLSVRLPDGSWRAWDLVKYSAMVFGVAYLFGGLRESEEAEKRKPYILCTNCGKRNHDPGAANLAGWSCGYCSKPTLVRVGTQEPTP